MENDRDDDLIHAGSAYSETNFRLHAYLNVANILRRRNTNGLFPLLQNDSDLLEYRLFNCEFITTKPEIFQRHLNRQHLIHPQEAQIEQIDLTLEG